MGKFDWSCDYLISDTVIFSWITLFQLAQTIKQIITTVNITQQENLITPIKYNGLNYYLQSLDYFNYIITMYKYNVISIKM